MYVAVEASPPALGCISYLDKNDPEIKVSLLEAHQARVVGNGRFGDWFSPSKIRRCSPQEEHENLQELQELKDAVAQGNVPREERRTSKSVCIQEAYASLADKFGMKPVDVGTGGTGADCWFVSVIEALNHMHPARRNHIDIPENHKSFRDRLYAWESGPRGKKRPAVMERLREGEWAENEEVLLTAQMLDICILVREEKRETWTMFHPEDLDKLYITEGSAPFEQKGLIFVNNVGNRHFQPFLPQKQL